MQEHCVAISPDDYRNGLSCRRPTTSLGVTRTPGGTRLIGIERAERALAAHPDVPLAATLGAGALARLGETERALEWVSRALTIAPDDPLTQFNAACTYSVLGEDRAGPRLVGALGGKGHRNRPAIWLIDSDFKQYPRPSALPGAADAGWTADGTVRSNPPSARERKLDLGRHSHSDSSTRRIEHAQGIC